jgi:hypothetical protein
MIRLRYLAAALTAGGLLTGLVAVAVPAVPAARRDRCRAQRH